MFLSSSTTFWFGTTAPARCNLQLITESAIAVRTAGPWLEPVSEDDSCYAALRILRFGSLHRWVHARHTASLPACTSRNARAVLARDQKIRERELARASEHVAGASTLHEDRSVPWWFCRRTERRHTGPFLPQVAPQHRYGRGTRLRRVPSRHSKATHAHAIRDENMKRAKGEEKKKG